MLSEILSYEFMTRSLIAGVLVGGMCGALGVFVVLRRLAFFGEGVGHASLLGVALAICSGFTPVFGSLVIAVLFSLMLGYITQRTQVQSDTAIGVLFSSTMAVAILLLSQSSIRNTDMTSLLFGSLLSITWLDLQYACVISAVIFASLICLYRPLAVYVFDEQFARRIGIRTSLVNYALLILLSLTVVSGIRLVGVLLVSALLTAPASVALAFARSLREAVFVATFTGVAICETGIILSYAINTPPGATIVVLAGGVFFIGHTLSRLRLRNI